MNTTELMLGDYVFNTEHGGATLEKVSKIEKEKVWIENSDTPVSIKYIHPVNILPSYRSLIGFERRSPNIKGYWFKECSFPDFITILFEYGTNRVSLVEINVGNSHGTYRNIESLHELQHLVKQYKNKEKVNKNINCKNQ